MAAPQFTPEEIEFLEPTTLFIEWGDGHQSLFSHRELREKCECAACIDEWTREPILDPNTLPADIRILHAEPTGRYGLNLHFSDRHQTGIYSFRSLRENCPCSQCSEESAPAGAREAPPLAQPDRPSETLPGDSSHDA